MRGSNCALLRKELTLTRFVLAVVGILYGGR